MTYQEISDVYDKAMTDLDDLMEKQKLLDKQVERAMFILDYIRQYLEDPTTFKLNNDIS